MRSLKMLGKEEETEGDDFLPEDIHYRDEGCDLYPACLTCPLPRCRYDDPWLLRRERNRARDRELVRLYRGGAHPDRLARQFGVSRRSVYRIIKGARS